LATFPIHLSQFHRLCFSVPSDLFRYFPLMGSPIVFTVCALVLSFLCFFFPFGLFLVLGVFRQAFGVCVCICLPYFFALRVGSSKTPAFVWLCCSLLLTLGSLPIPFFLAPSRSVRHYFGTNVIHTCAFSRGTFAFFCVFCWSVLISCTPHVDALSSSGETTCVFFFPPPPPK